MKRLKTYSCFVLALLAGLVIATEPATAGPMFSVFSSSTLKVSRFISPFGESFDVRGVAGLDVFAPGFIGSILLEDPVGGTDMNVTDPNGTLPFGNNALYVFGGPPSEAAVILLDLTNPLIGPGTTDLIALGIPFIPNPPTNPALKSILGKLRFDFFQTDFATDGTDTLVTYSLSSVQAVPEPATAALLFAGLGMLALARRRYRPN